MNKKINKEILELDDIYKTYTGSVPNKAKEAFREWLPLVQGSNLAHEFAYLVAKIMGDGHLDNHFTVKLVSSKSESLDFIKELLIKKCSIQRQQIKLYRRDHSPTTHLLQINNSAFGRTLHALGAPKGNKTLTPFKIPKWIIESKESSRIFLQGLLEDELTTVKIERKSYVNKLRFNMRKIPSLRASLMEFLSQVKERIESFNVTCSGLRELKLTNHERVEYYFWILRNKENVIRFAENIGFRFNQEKTQKLLEAYKILMATKKPKIDKKAILRLRVKGYSIRQIANEVGTSRSAVHRLIVKERS